MSPEKTAQLIEIYPELFTNPDDRSSFGLFGFECGDGWFDLLKDLITDIKTFSEQMGPIRFGFDEDLTPLKVHQVKEKYGTLRFYTNWASDELSALVDKAEERSGVTCESCGGHGRMMERRGWFMVRCDGCYNEAK